MSAAVKTCKCDLEASLNVCRKEGRNKWRWFHGCSRYREGHSCGFFEWCSDERSRELNIEAGYAQEAGILPAAPPPAPKPVVAPAPAPEPEKEKKKKSRKAKRERSPTPPFASPEKKVVQAVTEVQGPKEVEVQMPKGVTKVVFTFFYS